MAINVDELDFADNPYVATEININKELLQLLERSFSEGKAQLGKTNEDVLIKTWTLRDGDQILMNGSKAEIIRIAFSQIVHHRAQLGVYLRLLNVPIPGSFGPSADETGF